MKAGSMAILTILGLAFALMLPGCDVRFPRKTAPVQKSPIVAEPWMTKPPESWPQMVLTNQAAFRGHTPLKGASSFLIRTEDNRILAGTAKHLIGSAGGVEPVVTLNEFNSVLQSWRMSPRTVPGEFVEIEALGMGVSERHNGDWLILKLKSPPSNLPSQPLHVRAEPVHVGERVYLIGVPYTERDRKQNVYVGTVTARLAGDRFRYDLNPPVVLPGFSGAPIIDEKGYLVGVMTVCFDAKMRGDLWLEGGGEDASTIYDELERSH